MVGRIEPGTAADSHTRSTTRGEDDWRRPSGCCETRAAFSSGDSSLPARPGRQRFSEPCFASSGDVDRAGPVLEHARRLLQETAEQRLRDVEREDLPEGAITAC